jgi:hypothetical protein
VKDLNCCLGVPCIATPSAFSACAFVLNGLDNGVN